ncbi:MAG TPA: hypothetical protein VIL20_02845, partial [Sandaracinaceae bacterium]
TYVLPVGTVITAIGYTAMPLAGVPISEWGTCYANQDGKIRDRLWAVGWAKRGPSGVIATNRQDSAEVAHMLLAELSGGDRRGPEGLDHLLAQRGAMPVTYSHWERIDELERAAAPEGAPRKKITSFEELLAAARG